MAQLMPLPLIVSCFSKIQIGFTFLVPAHLGSPGQRPVKRVYVTQIKFNRLVEEKCPHDHRPTDKLYLSDIRVWNISKSFTYKIAANIDSRDVNS